MTVYYNTLICIRIRIYFLKMKYFVLNTSINNDTKVRKTATPGFCCGINKAMPAGTKPVETALSMANFTKLRFACD